MPTRSRRYQRVVEVLVALASVFALISTTPSNRVPPPDQIVEVTRQWIVERVGLKFADRYYTYRPDHSGVFRQDSCYVVRWMFEMPECTDVRCVAEFYVLIDGEMLWEPTGVPDCARDPRECEIRIGRAQAIELAKQSKFDPGHTPWDVRFCWKDGFAWEVCSEFYNAPGGGGGITLEIDANDGNIIGRHAVFGHGYDFINGMDSLGARPHRN
jgi:hypothetical protein